MFCRKRCKTAHLRNSGSGGRGERGEKGVAIIQTKLSEHGKKLARSASLVEARKETRFDNILTSFGAADDDAVESTSLAERERVLCRNLGFRGQS